MLNAKRLLSAVPYYVCLGLLVYMPFHIFITQSASLLTGGLSVWKVAKDAIVALLTMFVICMVLKQGKYTRLFNVLVISTVLYGVLHIILWLIHPDIYRSSAILGITYNMRVPCFAIIGYGAVLLRPDVMRQNSLVKLVIGVGTIVAVLGITQYFLPSDILTHVGYSVARGVKPNFFIDDRPNLPRIMSTLRDPNSLGAYLIVPIVLLVSEIVQVRNRKHQLFSAVLLCVQLAALWLTFSRSALAAAIFGSGLFLAMYFWQGGLRFLRRFWLVIVVVLIFAAGGVSVARNSYFEKSIISHHTGTPKGQYDSNGYHWVFVKRGLSGILHNPLGHGPGTAGLASIQNPKGSFLTENYYIQIGYEVGVLGLLVFAAISVVVYVKLYQQRSNPLAAVLIATFWAYVVMNMLLHTWSNEAVACQWWLLAGLTLGLVGTPKTSKLKRSEN